ncbi:MAG: LamG domain-containing protein [Candidatus Pacebacteria bacterium]|nr:LamG domain-containing protein [Candidatus Paceibacterota bacterium]
MNQKSFTLIEILVVIVIIGIISAFIIVSMAGVSSRATIAKGQAFSSSLKNSLLMNLVSEWKFDELSTATTGATISDSWGENNGTLSTGDAFDKLKTGGECVSGKCLSFDGSNDYVSFPDLGIPINGPATISGWFYFKDTAKTRGVAMRLYGAFLYQHAANDYIYISGGSDYFGWRAVLNSWYYLVLTYSGNAYTAKLYINGTLKNVSIQSGSDVPAFSNLISNNGQAFNGLIDDVRVCNAAIPTSEIQQNYFLGLNSLYKNGGLTQLEYSERLAELKTNLAQD